MIHHDIQTCQETFPDLVQITEGLLNRRDISVHNNGKMNKIGRVEMSTFN